MVDSAKIILILDKISDRIIAEKEYLTDLDAPIGDSDHGINMAKGFTEVKRKLPELAGQDAGTIFKTAGMILVSTVGGSSGPLYGTAFMKMGIVLAGKKEVNFTEFMDAFKLGVEGVMQRGRSTAGEKTMLDAMIPAMDAMNKAYAENQDGTSAFLEGVKAAKAGVLYTKTIVATKGRASYVGERSIGHQDPGATSFTFILLTAAENL